MSRTALVGNITAMLEDAGFLVSERCSVRPKSFDLAARRGEDLVLLKILGNIDAFTVKRVPSSDGWATICRRRRW